MTDAAAPGAMPRLSLVIPVHIGGDELATQLQATTTQDSPHLVEVIVFDDGSADVTAALVKSFDQRLPSHQMVREPRREADDKSPPDTPTQWQPHDGADRRRLRPQPAPDHPPRPADPYYTDIGPYRYDTGAAPIGDSR